MPPQVWFFVILAIGVFVVLSNTRIITTPNIALVRRNGRILPNVRLTPGLRVVWTFWGLIEVDEDVHVPGGLIDVNIPVEEVVSRNQAITFNTRILIAVIKAPDGLPAYLPAYNFINWLTRASGSTIEEQMEDLLSSLVSGASETIIKGYDPQRVTSSPEVNRRLAEQIAVEVSGAIKAWGVVHTVIIEDLKNPLAVQLETQKQQMLVDKKRITTQAEADAQAIKHMRKVNGDKIGMIYAQGKMLKEAKNVTLNLFGSGVTDAIEGLTNVIDTTSQRRRRPPRERGTRRRRKGSE